MYVAKLTEGASRLIFGEVVAFGGEVQKCQNGVCDLDLENEVKVLQS